MFRIKVASKVSNVSGYMFYALVLDLPNEEAPPCPLPQLGASPCFLLPFSLSSHSSCLPSPLTPPSYFCVSSSPLLCFVTPHLYLLTTWPTVSLFLSSLFFHLTIDLNRQWVRSATSVKGLGRHVSRTSTIVEKSTTSPNHGCPSRHFTFTRSSMLCP